MLTAATQPVVASVLIEVGMLLGRTELRVARKQGVKGRESEPFSLPLGMIAAETLGAAGDLWALTVTLLTGRSIFKSHTPPNPKLSLQHELLWGLV